MGIDEINLPSLIKPYMQKNVNGYPVATDLLAFLTDIPHADCVVYNQAVQLPHFNHIFTDYELTLASRVIFFP